MLPGCPGYLPVQPLHQGDVARFRVHAEVVRGAWIKREAVPHLLSLEVRAVEAVDVCSCGGHKVMHIMSGIIIPILIIIHQTDLNYPASPGLTCQVKSVLFVYPLITVSQRAL